MSGAAIHDLGYKRYIGTRRPQSTRWRVIVGHVVATSWRGWWRLKMWMIGVVATTIGIGVPIYISKFLSDEVSDLRRGGAALKWADALLPMSFQFYSWFAFLVGATVAAGQVARDLRAGAFEFYFSRPVRPIDYMLGKIGGTAVVMGLALAAGPLLLALFRLCLSRSASEVWATASMVPRSAMVGGLAALAYAIVPLAFSALSSRPRITTSMWVVFYLMFGGIVTGLARALDQPDLEALNLPKAVSGLAFGAFDVRNPFEREPGAAASAAALAGYIAVGLAVLYARVRRAERAGLGGG